MKDKVPDSATRKRKLEEDDDQDIPACVYRHDAFLSNVSPLTNIQPSFFTLRSSLFTLRSSFFILNCPPTASPFSVP